jgi:glycerol-3-phosphate O-acyltransferase
MRHGQRSVHRLEALVRDPRFPVRHGPIVLGFVEGYRAAAADAGLSVDEIERLLCTLVDRLAEQLDAPFRFEPYHQQIREPFDHYRFGLDFLRPLVDAGASTVVGLERLDRIAGQLASGENVLFMANHQTEGDPQAIGLLLEPTHPAIGQHLIFIAGERVLQDPLAVPFSMGCNLLCIYSKRYLDRPPGRTARQQHNRRTLERMVELLDGGGRCIYVAPSGGRDRPSAQGDVEVAPFDPQSVEMLHLTTLRSSRRTHVYPMALATYAILPPPETVQAELGETRHVRRAGIHLAVADEFDMERFPGSELTDRQARREARALALWEQVRQAHDHLHAQGGGVSNGSAGASNGG